VTMLVLLPLGAIDGIGFIFTKPNPVPDPPAEDAVAVLLLLLPPPKAFLPNEDAPNAALLLAVLPIMILFLLPIPLLPLVLFPPNPIMPPANVKLGGFLVAEMPPALFALTNRLFDAADAAGDNVSVAVAGLLSSLFVCKGPPTSFFDRRMFFLRLKAGGGALLLAVLVVAPVVVALFSLSFATANNDEAAPLPPLPPFFFALMILLSSPCCSFRCRWRWASHFWHAVWTRLREDRQQGDVYNTPDVFTIMSLATLSMTVKYILIRVPLSLYP